MLVLRGAFRPRKEAAANLWLPVGQSPVTPGGVFSEPCSVLDTTAIGAMHRIGGGDFISDDSITEFLRKIESTIGVNITIKPPIATLKHKDYQGKRVFITIKDDYGNTLESKLDIGVHKDLDIKQEEYCFDICFQKDGASLLMNSKEQILTEKLKSFLRFGTRSTRYKDVFDICFLLDNVNIEELKTCIQHYIFNDKSLPVSTYAELTKRIRRVFTNIGFKNNAKSSGKNWLDITTEEALIRNIEFIVSLEEPVA